jgi:plasmid maintenance system antidote protein VapI
MSSDVFMNRIRFLGLARVFNLPPLKGKVIINVIDSMIRDRQTLNNEAATSEVQNESIANLLDGAERLCDDTVSKASTVGTQFWLATEDMADLLACGQATMCYNLLKHMERMKKDGLAEIKGDLFIKIYHQAATDWEKLKANPYYLMDDPYRDLK